MIELVNRQEVIDTVKESIVAHLCYTLDDPEVGRIIKELSSIPVIGKIANKEEYDFAKFIMED